MGCFGSKEALPEPEKEPEKIQTNNEKQKQPIGGGAMPKIKVPISNEFRNNLPMSPRSSFGIYKKPTNQPEIPVEPPADPTEASQALSALLREELGKPLRKKIYKNKLTVAEITLEEDWTDFGYITECTQVEVIDLSYTDFNDPQSLANCKKLKVLNLENAEGDYSTNFTFPKRLEELNVVETNFSNWQALVPLQRFKRLVASSCDYEWDETGYQWPESLEELDLGCTNFTDLNSLATLSNLKKLDLKGDEGDISGKCPLQPTLAFFDVSETNFDDIDFLRQLKASGCREMHCAEALENQL